MWCVSFRPFFLSCLLVFSLFPFQVLFRFRFFDVELFVHPVFFVWVLCGLLGFCGDLYSVPRVPDTYVRGPLFLFLRCRCASVIICVLFLAFYFIISRGILPLKTYWSLSCDQGLHSMVAMSSCKNNKNSNNHNYSMKLLVP